MQKFIVTAWDNSHQVIQAVYYVPDEAQRAKTFFNNNGISAVIQTEEIKTAAEILSEYQGEIL